MSQNVSMHTMKTGKFTIWPSVAAQSKPASGSCRAVVISEVSLDAVIRRAYAGWRFGASENRSLAVGGFGLTRTREPSSAAVGGREYSCRTARDSPLNDKELLT